MTLMNFPKEMGGKVMAGKTEKESNKGADFLATKSSVIDFQETFNPQIEARPDNFVGSEYQLLDSRIESIF